jgi:hypothetical protein
MFGADGPFKRLAAIAALGAHGRRLRNGPRAHAVPAALAAEASVPDMADIRAEVAVRHAL